MRCWCRAYLLSRCGGLVHFVTSAGAVHGRVALFTLQSVVEHMSCNRHVHFINVMLTRSRKVRDVAMDHRADVVWSVRVAAVGRVPLQGVDVVLLRRMRLPMRQHSSSWL